jgi:hypothetical protein
MVFDRPTSKHHGHGKVSLGADRPASRQAATAATSAPFVSRQYLAEMQLKKDSRARAKGAEKANQIRTAWEYDAISKYAQLLHERPTLRPKQLRYEVRNWMDQNSKHPKRITDTMMLAALRRPENKSVLAEFKRVLETPARLCFDLRDDPAFQAAAVQQKRLIEAKYARAFDALVKSMAEFKIACINAGKTGDFASEIQRAAQVVRNKAPARAKRLPTKE